MELPAKHILNLKTNHIRYSAFQLMKTQLMRILSIEKLNCGILIFKDIIVTITTGIIIRNIFFKSG